MFCKDEEKHSKNCIARLLITNPILNNIQFYKTEKLSKLSIRNGFFANLHPNIRQYFVLFSSIELFQKSIMSLIQKLKEFLTSKYGVPKLRESLW